MSDKLEIWPSLNKIYREQMEHPKIIVHGNFAYNFK